MADDKNAQERLAEQQAAFNKEALKTEELLGNLSSLLRDGVEDALKNSAKKVRDLNTSLGQGVDITKKLNTEILNSGKRIEELEFQRQLNLATLTKAQAIEANRKLDAELKIENKLNSQLQLLQQHLDKEEALTEEKKKQNDIIGNIKKKADSMFLKTATDLFTVTGILDAIVSRIDIFNKGSVQIGKGLGYGAEQADRVERKMMGISLSAQSSTANIKNLNEAYADLNTATGGVAEYSDDALKTQVMLTKQFGLTGEEAAGIYKFSTLTGKSSEKINDEMVSAFVNTRNAVKGSADFKTTIAAAAKVSGQLSANFKNDPKLITAAIVKMQALGTTIEQTQKQGESLLNFETSLDNELKAELLTGKQLNLERARAAALAGDQVTLAEELAKNVGTLDDFQRMNVIQQKALAESMGMTTDEMADQLRKQKIAQEQGKSIAEINAADAKDAQKRQAIQDKFNDAMEKLKDIIGSVAVALAPFIDGLTWLLDNTFALYGILVLMAALKFTKIKDSFKGIGDTFKNIKEKLTGKGGGLTEKATEGAETTSTATSKSEEGGDGSKFKTKMQNIAEGIKAFGNKDVLFGALNLIPASIGLIAMIPGVIGIKLIEQVKGEKFQEAMYGIAYGISNFGENVTAGALLKLLFGGIALTAFALGVPALLLLQLVNGTLIEKTLTGIGKGIKGFSESVSYGDLIKGAVAIALFGASLIPFAYALTMMAGVKMEDILAAAAGLVIFGAAVLGLGALMMSGVGAAIFGAGILAFIALGGAMIILGIGLKAVSEGGKGIAQLFQQLSELDPVKLDAVAPALKTIGEAVLFLGAGAVMGALGKLLGGDSPSKMIQDIAASASGITQAATGLQLMATSLQQVASALAAIDTSKLEALSDFASESVTGGITDFITAPIKAIGDMIGGGGGGNENKAVVDALNEVKASIDKLYQKEMIIKIDGKTVGTTLTQGSTKGA
jgi:hypothetical protein